jgi:serine/threonine protein kinase/tetratricopeptide (TPR) repeat protein
VLKGELGRGGFATVHLAREEGARRDVALKSAGDRIPSAAELTRFLEEAYVTAQLQHPGVVPIYRIDRDADGRDYYTMRPIEGRTLESVLDELRAGEEETLKDFPLRRLVRVLHSVCQTVRFAHDRGVIHRDLKPSNIVVGEYGEVLVIDWGLAKVIGAPEAEPDKRLDEDAELKSSVWARYQREVESLRHGEDSSLLLTMDGTISGTPLYMSPEQARGLTGEIDRRSDVWALGVMLYEICTLKWPFEGESFEELVGRITAAEPPDPLTANPRRRVPPELAEIALKCLEADKSERCQSVADLAQDIENWLEGIAPWRLVADIDFSAMPDGEPEGWTALVGTWRVENACLTYPRSGDTVILWDVPTPGDVRVEVEAMVIEDEPGEISPVLSAPPSGTADRYYAGYCFQFGGDGNTRSKLAKDGADMVVADVTYSPGRWHLVAAERVGDLLRLAVDGDEVLAYRDYAPLSGDRVGLYTHATGLRVRHFRVFSQGVPVTVSCLAVPNSYYNKGMVEEARKEYLRIAESHPGREEGLEALFLVGKCCLDLARGKDLQEHDKLLVEAGACFERVESSFLAPLGCLGKSLILEARGELEAEADELARAFRDYPGYDTLHVLGERLWYRAAAFKAQLMFDRIGFFLRPAVRHHFSPVLSGGVAQVVAMGLDPEGSRRLLGEMVEQSPSGPDHCAWAVEFIAERFLHERRWDEAIETFRKLLETYPRQERQCREAHLRTADAERYRGGLAASQEIYDRLLAEHHGKWSATRELTGMIQNCILQGDFARALELCDRVLADFSQVVLECGRVLVAKGAIHLLRGNRPAARDAFGESLEILGRSAERSLHGDLFPRAVRAALRPEDTDNLRWVTERSGMRRIYEFALAVAAFSRGDEESAAGHLRRCWEGEDWSMEIWRTRPLAWTILKAWGRLPEEGK